MKENRLTGAAASFKLPLKQLVKTVILKEYDWLHFVDLVQRKAKAQTWQHQDAKCRFQAWARSGLLAWSLQCNLPKSDTSQ
jgi:hypothetical protein